MTSKRQNKSKAQPAEPVAPSPEGIEPPAAPKRSRAKSAPKQKPKQKQAKRAAKAKPAATKRASRSKSSAPKRTASAGRGKSAPAKRRKATTNPDLCPLTGALRVEVWSERLREAVDLALREGGSLTVALIDVDDFSRHQSELETERADALLKGLVARWGESLTAIGVQGSELSFGRLAGDLFGLVLTRELEEAMGLVALARASVQRSPLKVGRGVRRREVSATLSAGLASLRRDGTRGEELLSAAQGALWRAKSLGGDRLGIPDTERMTLKSSYYPQTQLDQLKALAKRAEIKESVLLREALGDLFLKYKGRRPEAPIG